MTIECLCVSPAHNFFGHHGGPAGTSAVIEQDAIECVAGRGVRGDRFFDHAPDYKGQITFFSAEVFAELCVAVGARDRPASAVRRNVVVQGADLNALIGREFEIQGVRFVGTEECRPCYWMDQAVGPGAEAWLQGRGGLRARILTDGWLRRVGSGR
jgi:MOSC domain-containing protein YiiM